MAVDFAGEFGDAAVVAVVAVVAAVAVAAERKTFDIAAVMQLCNVGSSLGPGNWIRRKLGLGKKEYELVHNLVP